MLYNFEDLTFQIVTVDRFFHKKGLFSVKARPFSALSFRTSGTGSFVIGGKSFFVKTGDILYIPGGVPYEVEYSVSESIVIHLLDCNYGEAEVYCPNNQTALSLMFERLLEDWLGRRSVSGVKSAVYGILEKIEDDQKTALENVIFERCLQYVETHFCDPSLRVAEICNQGFISVSSLQRAFLQRLGVSPMQYVMKLRMNKAVRLLVENQCSVKETASLCGFSDEKYFSRVFKEKYGYPPSRLKEHS